MRLRWVAIEAEVKTKEAIDSDGWLHSGDVGAMDGDGMLRITGRLKELIITAGGENVPPVLIEDAIKAAVKDWKSKQEEKKEVA